MLEETRTLILEFKKSVLKIAESSQNYIAAHNDYLNNNLKDATLIKKRIKDKIIGVVDENK